MLSVDKDVHAIQRYGRVMENNPDRTIIYLTEERRYGYLVSLGAFVSRVEYDDGYGNIVDTFLENEDFEIWEEPITYEQE